MSYKVYWTYGNTPTSRDFDSDSLTLALNHCEALRKQQRAGDAVGFVTMVSENPNSVGNSGVDVTDASYDWKKRR